MEISLIEVINAIAVERLRTQGCFNLRVAVIRLTPEIYTERYKEQNTELHYCGRMLTPSFKWTVTVDILRISILFLYSLCQGELTGILRNLTFFLLHSLYTN